VRGTRASKESPDERSIQRRRLVVSLFTLFLLIASSGLLAATVADRLAGRWEAEVTGDGKTFSFIFDFTTKGNALTRTVVVTGFVMWWQRRA
jgi:hypothetical protein